MTAKYPAIPDPGGTPQGLRDTVLAAKETIEVLVRQRGSIANSAVTWSDLVNLGLITASQIPTTRS